MKIAMHLQFLFYTLALMKKIRYIMALLLVVVVVVESAGFSMINYCTGKIRVIPAISNIEMGQEIKCLKEQNAEFENLCDIEPCCSHCSDSHKQLSLCDDNHIAPGIHSHHHEGKCVKSFLFQLLPLQKTLSYCLPIFVSNIIYIIDITIQDVFEAVALKYVPLTPKYPGRTILAHIQSFLI